MPVSYTHLDVYKRQGPINRGVEFDSYMADHPQRSVILEQVYAGICVRMAILYLLLGGADNGLAS